MKKKKGLLIGIFLFLLIILLIGSFFFFRKKDIIANLFHPEIPQITENEEILDNVNGVYVLEENLGQNYNIYTGCNVNKIYQYILVVYDTYEVYRSTCMGTYLLNEGNTESLDLSYDESKKQYIINYNDVFYTKKEQVYEIITNNQIEEKLSSIYLDSYRFIIKETEFFGNYYPIMGKHIANSNGNYLMDIIPQGSSIFLRIYKGDINSTTLYSYQGSNIDALPILSSFFDKIVILENNSFLQNTRYNLLTIDAFGTSYNLEEKFPIVIDGVSLTKDLPLFIKYNTSEKNYHLYVGLNSNFCASNENEISYYEFKIEYNYSKRNLDDPIFLQMRKGSNGCEQMKQIMEG